MKRALLPVVLTLGAIVSCNAIAETTWNYTWQGKKYIANSTGGVNNSIIKTGRTLKFIAVTDNCVRGTGDSTNFGDDCDRNIVRSQLQNKALLDRNKNLKYTFSIKHDGTTGKGIRTGINIFEIKPMGGSTATVPTFVLYFDPKSRTLKSMTSLSNHIAPGSKPVDIFKTIGKLNSKWNNFQIETKQANDGTGYIRIKQNGKLIYAYNGPTAYKHNFGLQYWFGPYICCGNTPEGEPNHTFLYKGITAGYTTASSAAITPVKPKIKITRSNSIIRGDRFSDFSTAIQYDTDNSPFAMSDYIIADVGERNSKYRFAVGVDGSVENKLDKPILFGYRFDNILLGIAIDSSYYGYKGNPGFDLGNTNTTYLLFDYNKKIKEHLTFNTTVTYGTATTKQSEDILNSPRSNAFGFNFATTYLLDERTNKTIQASFSQPFRIEKGEMEFNTFIADFEPEGRELQYAMQYNTDLDRFWKLRTEASFTSDKNNIRNNDDVALMIYFNWRG